MTVHESAFYWFTLFSTRGLGPRTINSIRKVLTRHGLTLDEVASLSWPQFREVVPQLPHEVYEQLQSTEHGRLWGEYASLLDKGIDIVHPDHTLYPCRVSELLGADTPPLLFCRGRLSLLCEDSIAIVGSRHASDENLEFAADLASGLALQGFNIVSGYAAGVDTMAHLGALQRARTTTMVLSTGILDFRRKADYRAVPWEENVLAVSQFQPHERWLARNAMVRNKLVCAMSSAVVVVEAGPRRDEQGRMSGTFDAGVTALALGIPLFILPPEDAGGAAIGNAELLRLGGLPLSATRGDEQIVAALRSPLESAPSTARGAAQGRLL